MRLLLPLAALTALVACAPTTPPSPEGNVGMRCITHEDCALPMDYAIRSSCPFAARCIGGACAVICPMHSEEPNPTPENTWVDACTDDADCECDTYQADNLIRCTCLDGACAAVVEE